MLLSALSGGLDFISNLFFPNLCLECSQNLMTIERLFCGRCWEKVPVLNPLECPFCLVCNTGTACSCLEFTEAGLNPCLSGWLYDGALRSIVHQIKYKGRRKLGLECGRRLAANLERFLPGNIDFVLGVPSSAPKKRERGYSQAEIIGEGFCERAGIPFRKNILIRSNAASSQTLFSREERFANIAGNFRIRRQAAPMIQNKSILIVDDVMTTGATLSECSRKLREAGAKSVAAVTLSRALPNPEQRE